MILTDPQEINPKIEKEVMAICERRDTYLNTCEELERILGIPEELRVANVSITDPITRKKYLGRSISENDISYRSPSAIESDVRTSSGSHGLAQPARDTEMFEAKQQRYLEAYNNYIAVKEGIDEAIASAAREARLSNVKRIANALEEHLFYGIPYRFISPRLNRTTFNKYKRKAIVNVAIKAGFREEDIYIKSR